MKTILPLVAIIMTGVGIVADGPVWANGVTSKGCMLNYCGFNPTQMTSPQNCATTESLGCLGTGESSGGNIPIGGKYEYKSCKTCPSGFTRKAMTANTGDKCGTLTWYTCVKEEPDCDGTCDNCESTGWTKGVNGTETRTVATCNTQTCICTKKFESRCAAGYYGTGLPTVGGSSCTQCPSPGTSAAGSTSQSDCYIPAGTTGSDSTGTYKYTANCYY